MACRATGLAVLALLLAVAAVPTAQAVIFADATDAPQVEEGVVGGSRPGLGTETDSANTRGKREGAEQFVFQAEVNRLMDIIINSLYSNKDIFLRELISNASDALDKIRFLALTDKGQLGEGEAAKLDIQLSLDPSKKVLSIRDKGVGMTKDDLIKNLGTIAKSGTSGFLEQMQKGGDVNLIGQFGVGFYSVYLVADWVEVITKHNDDKQYVWQSTADGHFSIAEDDGEDIGRGTVINIHLKPEAQEYSEESKLRDLVHKYSEFIHFPIYLWTEKEVDVPVEEEEQKEEADKGEEKADADDEEVADDESEDEEAEETQKKTRKEKRHEWELLNDSQAIWLRQPKDVSDEEYKKFYKTISQDYADPMGWVHFKGEGDVEFKATLFMPATTPHEYYEKYYEKGAKGALKLYVRRVFITDDTGEDLLPRWLGFLRGIVDSDTLPLNVSREMMQTSAALKTIKKKLVRKVLDLIKKWSDDELKCRKAEGGEDDEDEPAPTGEACEMYGKFWEQYGRAMKLGIVEDATNRNRMAKLLRFHTSKSLDKLTSLDEYVSRMKEGQKQIYYLAGSSKEEIAKSPFVEQLLRKDYEVIYFTDVLDEYVMQHVPDYEDKAFANASKEDLKMADKDEQEKKKDKELKEEFKPLTKWWKKVLGNSVTNVKVSNRLALTPCAVVAGKYGQSANMERIMRAQAFADPSRAAAARSQKVLEINPRHPLIRSLKERVAESEDADENTTELGHVLFDAALLESGFVPENAKSFTARVQSLVGQQLGVDPDADVDMDDGEEEAEEEAQEAEEAGQKEEAKDEL